MKTETERKGPQMKENLTPQTTTNSVRNEPNTHHSSRVFSGKVNIPEGVDNPAAYAAAFRRGFAGVRLDFFSLALAPVLGRGWLDGNRYAENVRTTAEAVAEYIAAPVVKKARRTRKAKAA